MHWLHRQDDDSDEQTRAAPRIISRNHAADLHEGNVNFSIDIAIEADTMSNVCLRAGCRGRMMTVMSRQQQRRASSRSIAQQSQKTRRKPHRVRKRKTMSSE